MKKKNIFLMVVVIIIFLCKIDVFAQTTCTIEEERILKKEALQVEVSYELSIWDDPYETEDEGYYYNIIVLNLNQNLYVKVKNVSYGYDNLRNGELILKNAYAGGGYKTTVEIYASSNSKCNNTLLRTIKVQLPYYNKYSEREECNNYKNYNICKRNANTSDISEEEFLRQIEKIKEKERNQNVPIEDEEEQKESIFQKFINFYLQNKKVTIPITVFILLVIIILPIIIIRKNKKRIKVDFGGKL